jgi:hypothetical protein
MNEMVLGDAGRKGQRKYVSTQLMLDSIRESDDIHPLLPMSG